MNLKMKHILFTFLFATVKACEYYKLTGFGDFDGSRYVGVFHEDIRLVYGNNTLKEYPDCNWVISSELYEFPKYRSVTCIQKNDFDKLNWMIEYDHNKNRYVNANIECANYNDIPFAVKVFLFIVIIAICLASGNLLYTIHHPRASET